jgi:hypothetical protein
VGADDRRQGWFERLPTIAKVLFVVLILAVAIFLRFSDAVDRAPVWLLAPLVIAVGIGGLVLALRKEWAEEARWEPAHVLLYLFRPLPLVVWRAVIGLIGLGIVALGVGVLIDSLT